MTEQEKGLIDGLELSPVSCVVKLLWCCLLGVTPKRIRLRTVTYSAFPAQSITGDLVDGGDAIIDESLPISIEQFLRSTRMFPTSNHEDSKRPTRLFEVVKTQDPITRRCTTSSACNVNTVNLYSISIAFITLFYMWCHPIIIIPTKYDRKCRQKAILRTKTLCLASYWLCLHICISTYASYQDTPTL